jgi:hypothetical protein
MAGSGRGGKVKIRVTEILRYDRGCCRNGTPGSGRRGKRPRHCAARAGAKSTAHASAALMVDRMLPASLRIGTREERTGTNRAGISDVMGLGSRPGNARRTPVPWLTLERRVNVAACGRFCIQPSSTGAPAIRRSMSRRSSSGRPCCSTSETSRTFRGARSSGSATSSSPTPTSTISSASIVS